MLLTANFYSCSFRYSLMLKCVLICFFLIPLNSDLTVLNTNRVNRGQYVGNVNDITGEINCITVYRVGKNSTNIPVTAHGMLKVMVIDHSDYMIQEFSSLGDQPRLWIRCKIMGQWGNWVEK